MMEAFDYFRQRGVTRLCHFTTLKCLTHILCSEEGILASDFIRQDTKSVNDVSRYDGEPNHVCCSVQYPNCWYLKRAIADNRDIIFQDWVVIYISLEILKNASIKFCPCNASSAHGRYITDNFECLFEGRVSNGKRTMTRPSTMLKCCPTDDQAEVLVKEKVPRRFVSGIAVGSNEVGELISGIFPTINIESIPIYYAPDLFTTRWSDLVRAGRRPKETQI